MGRKKARQENKNAGVCGYLDVMKAVRPVGDHETLETIEHEVECHFGRTKTYEFDHFYANAESPSGKPFYRITIVGPKRDVVNIMFKSAIESVGFEIRDGKKKSSRDR